MCQVLLWLAQSVEHTELRHYIPRRKWYTIDPSRIGFTDTDKMDETRGDGNLERS